MTLLPSFHFKPEDFILIFFVLIAAHIDVRSRRIPNWLILSGTLIACIHHGTSIEGVGISSAIGGLILGMALFMPFYTMGIMGAGDVKLMGMVGAFFGPIDELGAILMSLVAGGILATAMCIQKRKVSQLTANLSVLFRALKTPPFFASRSRTLSALPSVGKMPYAVAIAAGTITQIILEQTGNTVL